MFAALTIAVLAAPAPRPKPPAPITHAKLAGLWVARFETPGGAEEVAFEFKRNGLLSVAWGREASSAVSGDYTLDGDTLRVRAEEERPLDNGESATFLYRHKFARCRLAGDEVRCTDGVNGWPVVFRRVRR